MGAWWLYFLTQVGNDHAEYELQKLATDRLHATFLIQSDPQVRADPAELAGRLLSPPGLRANRGRGRGRGRPGGAAKIRRRGPGHPQHVPLRGVFLPDPAGGRLDHPVSCPGAARSSSRRPASCSWPAPPTNSRRPWPACGSTPKPWAARGWATRPARASAAAWSRTSPAWRAWWTRCCP